MVQNPLFGENTVARRFVPAVGRGCEGGPGMVAPPDFYEILQVSPNADADIIRLAYRRLSQKWHPEKNPGDRSAAERMMLINEAYGVLSDPERRREYDAFRSPSATAGGAQEHTRASPSGVSPDPPQPTGEGGKRSEEPGEPFAPTNSDSEPSGTISPSAWVIFALGVFLFVMAHGRWLFANPLHFLGICGGWGLVFGPPACFCSAYQKRTGMTVVAVLFLVAAGCDVAASAYSRAILPPQTELSHVPARNVAPSWSATLPPSAPVPDGARGAKGSAATEAMLSIEIGLSLWKKGKLDDAIRAFDEAIRLDPSDARAFSRRGWCWIPKRQDDRAQSDFDEAIRLDPSDPRHRSDRGLVALLKEVGTAVCDAGLRDEVVRLNAARSRLPTGDVAALALLDAATDGTSERLDGLLDLLCNKHQILKPAAWAQLFRAAEQLLVAWCGLHATGFKDRFHEKCQRLGLVAAQIRGWYQDGQSALSDAALRVLDRLLDPQERFAIGWLGTPPQFPDPEDEDKNFWGVRYHR